MALPPQQPPRPPSPSEISYTKLAILAHPFGATNNRCNQQRSNGGRAVGNVGDQMLPPASMPLSAMPPAAAPRTAPPASISVPRILGNQNHGMESGSIAFSNAMRNNNGAGGPSIGQKINYQTPQHTQTMMPMSAPLPQPQYATQTMPHQQAISHLADPIHNRSTPVEDRVSNLALKLQAMQTPHHDQNNTYSPMLHSDQQQQHRSNRLNEVHQFIDTLKNMQMAVSRTVDEQQRVKKSRALNALLSMFESIIEDRSCQTTRVVMDPSAEFSIRQLEQRARQVEADNEQLNIICQERDGQLQQMNNELQRSQRELQDLTTRNEQLRNDLTHSQEQCHQERQRAQEAELVASESENVRNGLLSNYARLTEENVELQRAMDDMNLERDKIVTEFEMCQQEMNQMQSQKDQLTQQLQQKDMNIVELEKTLNDLNDQLVSHQNLLHSANSDRQRLQDELHSSRRNSTAASEQLIQLRDQFSQFRRESDSKRHGTNQRWQESAYVHDTKVLEEEPRQQQQQQRRNLEMTKTQLQEGMELAAQEQIRRISRLANAELNLKVTGTKAHTMPKSEMGLTDGISSHEVDSVMADHFAKGNNNASTTSDLKTKANDLDSLLEFSSSSTRPISREDSFLNGHLSNDNESAVGHATSRPSGSRKEDEHPNLMDYFYNQIKLGE